MNVEAERSTQCAPKVFKENQPGERLSEGEPKNHTDSRPTLKPNIWGS